EAQSPEVHAHQRHAVVRHEARARDERAVAAHDDGEVCLGGQRRHLHHRVGLALPRAGGERLHDDLCAPLAEHLGELVEDLGQARRVAFADDGHRLERGGHGSNYTERAMLSDRAQNLLKILVERYIADGEPVGSRVLSRASNLELSPATIRNVMADLEEMGFIASPHTSAGRVPTPKGYRFCVDTLMVVKPL